MRNYEQSMKIDVFFGFRPFPSTTKRTRPAESDFAIRFERKLIFLGQLLIGSMDLWRFPSHNLKIKSFSTPRGSLNQQGNKDFENDEWNRLRCEECSRSALRCQPLESPSCRLTRPVFFGFQRARRLLFFFYNSWWKPWISYSWIFHDFFRFPCRKL